ncbi:MAG: sugar ABC transporter substrate-binding protein [Burkholderiaceae bacterium]|nr:MAG: sugar ABC transporter substrate-binding protein [Burkholderiaceae bacterium]
MTTFHRKSVLFFLFAASLVGGAIAQQNSVQFMGAANAKVAKAAALKSKWDGPTSGPKLLRDKKIVFIAGDMSDAGTYGVFMGMKEAVNGAGWQLLSIDCRGRCNQSAKVVEQALDMKPSAIVLAGVDAASQTKGLTAAAVAKVPVVGWHASFKAGPVPGLFTNVTSDPKEAAQLASLYGAVEANNKTGIVVFTDTSNPYLATKSGAMVEVLKQCDTCRILGVEDLPVMESRKKFSGVIESLVKRHGTKWTHIISINDIYFDWMEKPEVEALLEGNKLRGISAGDGSTNAYKRIRKNDLQVGTVPEPLGLHGWQLVDELNRAMSDAAPSGYHAPLHLVTQQNINYDGGPKDAFDPSNDFRNKYLAYWAK